MRAARPRGWRPPCGRSSRPARVHPCATVRCSWAECCHSRRHPATYPTRDRASSLRGDGRPQLGHRATSRGRGEGAGGPADVRRHRAALRPGQPDHDVPARRPLAEEGRAAARAARRQHRHRPRRRHRRPVHRPRQGRHAPDLVRPQLRHARRRSQRQPAGAGRHPPPAAPRRVGRRRHVRLRAAQPASSCRRSSPSSPAWCAPADGSPCSTSACRTTGSSAGATTSTSARSSRRSARCSATAPRTATCPRASPTCRRARRWSAMLRAAGFADAEHHQLSGGLTQLMVGTRRLTMRAHTRPLLDDVDLNDVARGDGYLFVRDGVGIAGRGVAARVPLRRRAPPCSPRSSTSTRSAACTRSRSAWCRSSRVAVRARRSRRSLVGKAADGRRWVTVDRRRRSPTSASAPARRRRRRSSPSARSPRWTATSPPSRAARDAVRDGSLTKAVIAREVEVVQPGADRRARRAAAPQGDVRAQLPLLGRRLHRRLAGAAGRRRTATRCARTRSPAPRRAPATPTPIDAPPPSCSPARRTRSSTASSST